MYELVSLTVFAYDIYFLVTKSVDHQCGTQFVRIPHTTPHPFYVATPQPTIARWSDIANTALIVVWVVLCQGYITTEDPGLSINYSHHGSSSIAE